MGPAFANLLEIGGDQYEYIQSVIAGYRTKRVGTLIPIIER